MRTQCSFACHVLLKVVATFLCSLFLAFLCPFLLISRNSIQVINIQNQTSNHSKTFALNNIPKLVIVS